MQVAQSTTRLPSIPSDGLLWGIVDTEGLQVLTETNNLSMYTYT